MKTFELTHDQIQSIVLTELKEMHDGLIDQMKEGLGKFHTLPLWEKANLYDQISSIYCIKEVMSVYLTPDELYNFLYGEK